MLKKHPALILVGVAAAGLAAYALWRATAGEPKSLSSGSPAALAIASAQAGANDRIVIGDEQWRPATGKEPPGTDVLNWDGRTYVRV